jgi:GR25 family glycosyltransferase involved in LPS biosynthesis
MTLNCDVYLVHYLPLADRLFFMDNQLKSLGIEYRLITDESPDDCFYDDAVIRRQKLSNFKNYNDKLLTRADKSLIWKHHVCMKNASKSNRPSLILEDDAILLDNFVATVNSFLDEKDWDIIFPGSGCNLRVMGRGLIKVPHPASKCTDSYVVTPDAAKKLSTLDDSHLPIDWELAYKMMESNLSVYWYEPPIVRQGSQDGSLVSSINGKRENLFI